MAKQTSIGRLKTVTKKDGTSFNVIEVTQDIVLKKNDSIFLNDYTDYIDHLVKTEKISVAEGLERKANVKRVNTKTGTTQETRFVTMLQLDKREENGNKL